VVSGRSVVDGVVGALDVEPVVSVASSSAAAAGRSPPLCGVSAPGPASRRAPRRPRRVEVGAPPSSEGAPSAVPVDVAAADVPDDAPA
jgi:hypothetical protein